MYDYLSAQIVGPATATLSRVLTWAGDRNPSLGDCEGESRPGEIAEFLEETERLSERLGWDFAVVAAHASAATEGFSSEPWLTGFDPLPAPVRERAADAPGAFSRPREAAAAHVTWLAQRVADADEAVQDDLRDVGFGEMVPSPPPGERHAGARSLDDLAGDGMASADLREHLAGIRRESEPEPAERANLPPLPDIDVVASDAFFEGRGGVGPVAICYHMTWDLNLARILRLFAHRDNNKSANFVIARDGMVYQCVHSRHTAWTNGDYKDRRTGKSNKPRTDIPWLKRAVEQAERGGANLNRYTISYEFIGTPDDPAHEPQYRSAIMLSRHLCAKYGIPPHRGRQIRHADINSVGRSYDPGPRFDLGRIIRELGGDPSNLTD